MHKPLPALAILQGLFHYNPLTGSITNLTQRGPKAIGSDAIKIKSSKPFLFIPAHHTSGAWHKAQYYPAGQVAWYLHHETDPAWSESYVIPKDSDPLNLKINNLELSQEEYRAMPVTGRRRAKRVNETGIRRTAKGWTVSIFRNNMRHYIGTFPNKYEALNARNEALEHIEAGGYLLEPMTPSSLRRGGKQGQATGYMPNRKHNTDAKIIKNSLEEDDCSGTTIHDYDYKSCLFRVLQVGKMFWWRDRWWYKNTRYGAWTCDSHRNEHKRFNPRLVVKYPLSLVRRQGEEA